MTELPDALYGEVTRLSEEGNQLLEGGQYAEARALWLRAWDLLPEPREEWEAATWLLTSIGDSYFSERRFAEALEPLQQVKSLFVCRSDLRSQGVGAPHESFRPRPPRWTSS